ncbi:hypothetical protein AQUSIP_23910 [Aquicella siphonis]|uniref:Fimbrial assembly protein (PilN) n=2 Tax=Aquicella siphonis TaxID=254247 RepID=A0A5E4PJC1_9COXI|nr:hypothetical protein AQUSIP_23910 [Aquicella siphonis]
MIQINLLPWREQARRIKKAQFVSALTISVCVPLILILIIHLHLSRVAKVQQEVNATLQSAISQEQSVLNEMSSKEGEKQATDIQLRFIIDRYNESYHAVRVLNELVSLVPPDIFISQIKRNGNAITLSGLANNEDEVTHLIQSIAESPYFNQPVLVSIALAKNPKTANRRRFILKFDQKG